MRTAGATLAVASVLAGGCVGCSSPASKRPVLESPALVEKPAPPPAPRCRSEPQTTAVWATFAGDVCPWIVTRGPQADVLHLESLVLEPVVTPRGRLPGACVRGGCQVSGATSTAGPVLSLVEPSSASEMPAGVYIGLVAGEHIVFVDAWEHAGEPRVEGGIDLGPSFALAPIVCGSDVELVVVPRLPVSSGEPTPAGLVARAGRYRVGDGGRLIGPETGVEDRSLCHAVLSLP